MWEPVDGMGYSSTLFVFRHNHLFVNDIMNHDSIHAIQLFGSTKYFRLTWVSRKGNLKFDALSACVPLDFFIGIIHLSSDTPIYLYIILYYIIYIILYYIIYILYIYSISCCKNSHDVPICDLPSVFFFRWIPSAAAVYPTSNRCAKPATNSARLAPWWLKHLKGNWFFLAAWWFQTWMFFFSFSIIYGIMMVNDG